MTRDITDSGGFTLGAGRLDQANQGLGQRLGAGTIRRLQELSTHCED